MEETDHFDEENKAFLERVRKRDPNRYCEIIKKREEIVKKYTLIKDKQNRESSRGLFFMRLLCLIALLVVLGSFILFFYI